MNLVLERLTDNGVQTTGVLRLFSSSGEQLLKLDTLELSWKNNQRRISCIPNGVYQIAPKLSMRFGRTFQILNVPERDNVLIHSGNFNHNTKGCVLVGKGYRDINNDFQLDVLNSKISMKLLLSALNERSSITIITKFLDYELK